MIAPGARSVAPLGTRRLAQWWSPYCTRTPRPVSGICAVQHATRGEPPRARVSLALPRAPGWPCIIYYDSTMNSMCRLSQPKSGGGWPLGGRLPHKSPQFWPCGISPSEPIPASSQCGVHSAAVDARWWAEACLLPPSVARGLRTCAGRSAGSGIVQFANARDAAKAIRAAPPCRPPAARASPEPYLIPRRDFFSRRWEGGHTDTSHTS